MNLDPTNSHVGVLRGLASGQSIPPEWMSGAPHSRELRELADVGLVAWDAGAGKRGDAWARVREPGTRITPAGRAALALYDLGRSGQ